MYKISTVFPGEGLTLHLSYTDGATVHADVAGLLEGDPGVFAPLDDRLFFEQVHVGRRGRVVAWPGELDLDADVFRLSDDDPAKPRQVRTLAFMDASSARDGAVTPPPPHRIFIANPYHFRHQHVRCSVTTAHTEQEVAWMCGYLNVLHAGLPREIGDVRLPLEDDLSPWEMVTLLGAVYGLPPHIEFRTPPEPPGAAVVFLNLSVTQCREGEWGRADHRRLVARPGVRRALLLLALGQAMRAPDFHRGDSDGLPAPAPIQALHLLSRVLASGQVETGWTDLRRQRRPPGPLWSASPEEPDWVDRY